MGPGGTGFCWEPGQPAVDLSPGGTFLLRGVGAGRAEARREAGPAPVRQGEASPSTWAQRRPRTLTLRRVSGLVSVRGPQTPLLVWTGPAAPRGQADSEQTLHQCLLSGAERITSTQAGRSCPRLLHADTRLPINRRQIHVPRERSSWLLSPWGSWFPPRLNNRRANHPALLATSSPYLPS